MLSDYVVFSGFQLNHIPATSVRTNFNILLYSRHLVGIVKLPAKTASCTALKSARFREKCITCHSSQYSLPSREQRPVFLSQGGIDMDHLYRFCCIRIVTAKKMQWDVFSFNKPNHRIGTRFEFFSQVDLLTW